MKILPANSNLSILLLFTSGILCLPAISDDLNIKPRLPSKCLKSY